MQLCCVLTADITSGDAGPGSATYFDLPRKLNKMGDRGREVSEVNP